MIFYLNNPLAVTSFTVLSIKQIKHVLSSQVTHALSDEYNDFGSILLHVLAKEKYFDGFSCFLFHNMSLKQC